MPRTTWLGIEKPFPWLLISLIPISLAAVAVRYIFRLEDPIHHF